MEKNYYLHKNEKTGEIVYFEYEKIKGYPITPRTKLEDAIDVSKIVFVNPSMREKLIRKKVDIKIRKLIHFLDMIDDDGADEGAIQMAIMDSERLRVNILNRYVHYLGNDYASLCMRKIQLIVNQLKMKMYDINMKKSLMNHYFDNLYYLDDEEQKKGKGR